MDAFAKFEDYSNYTYCLHVLGFRGTTMLFDLDRTFNLYLCLSQE